MSINKLLLPTEHQVVCIRFHWAKFFGPLCLTAAGLIAACLLSIVARGSALGAVWVAWGVLFGWLLWKVAQWMVDYFVVTSKRIVLATGVLTRKVEMMPLIKVTDMSFHKSARGRLFGYGQFIFESAGQEQALREVDYIPYPEQLYLEVCGLIFSEEEPGD